MPYTREKPNMISDVSDLRETIPGWGADLDPSLRPAVPKENYRPNLTGAHWDFPERQQAKRPRERSTEHAFLTPVFGTVCPTRGLSGVVRRFAYRAYSEGETAHWLLLVAADRIDVLEGKVADIFRLKLPNPIGETGLLSEAKYHGLRSRLGKHRADVGHQLIDVGIYVGKTLALAGGAFVIARALGLFGLGSKKTRRRVFAS